MVFTKDRGTKDTPNSKMDCIQKESLYWDHRPYTFQTNYLKYNTDKIMRKSNPFCKYSTESTNEYPSIFTSKAYSNVSSSILSYIVGGFVGSKSQMNSNKSHNLSYDLSAAISNLLNPWRYENEKPNMRRTNEHFCGTSSKIHTDFYNKCVLNKSFEETAKEKKCVVNVVDIECLIAMPLKDIVNHQDYMLNHNKNLSKPDLEETNKVLLGLSDTEVCDMDLNIKQKKKENEICPEDISCRIESKLESECNQESGMQKSGLNNITDLSACNLLSNSMCDPSESVNSNLIPGSYSIGNITDTGGGQVKHSVNYLATERFRQQSECSLESTDSESFIVFDHTDEDSDLYNLRVNKLDLNVVNDIFDSDEESDGEVYAQDGDEDDCYETSSSSDECDFSSINKNLLLANDKWLQHYGDINIGERKCLKKVTFDNDVKVNKIIAWNHAYRMARLGPWEQLARDRFRFQERISRLSTIISPVLTVEHRNKIYEKLHS